jgi:hypothetical protein
VSGGKEVAVGSQRARSALGLMSPDVGGFVMEVASRIEPLATVLRRYNVKKADFQRMMADPTFREAISEAQAAFKSASNTPERIRTKAQLVTEALIEDMYLIASSSQHPAAARVSAFGALKGLTGLEKPDAPTHRQRFSLTINIPSGTGTAQQITVDAEEPEDDEGEYETIENAEDEEAEENPEQQGPLPVARTVRIIGTQHPRLAHAPSFAGGEGEGAAGELTGGVSWVPEPTEQPTSGTGL